MSESLGEPVVCSVGATDPWNAAGLGLDVRALAECGARPVSVVCAVTAQDQRGVSAASAVPPETIAAQFTALAGARIAAFRIGALVDARSVAPIAAALARWNVPVVYDPAFAPSAGGSFAGSYVVAAARAALLPLATVVTPNLAEAARLLDSTVPNNVDAMRAAARALVGLGARAALVTGGHLAGAPADVLFDGKNEAVFEDSRLPAALRGTGCLLAAALAAALARGLPLEAAVEAARSFVRRKIAGARRFGPMYVAY